MSAVPSMPSAGAVIQPGSCTQTTSASNRRRIYSARRSTSRPDQTSSLSLAMGLTIILTTIWVGPLNPLKSKALICKGNRTSTDSLGHAADVWGQKIEHGENALIDAHAAGKAHNQRTHAEAELGQLGDRVGDSSSQGRDHDQKQRLARRLTARCISE